MYWHTFLRALPSSDSRRSFLWHCDKGPSCHLKLLLYFNGTDEHGGNTQFLDRRVTDEFTKTGYLFGPVDARQEDLSDLAKDLSIDYSPQQWDIQQGEGIVFEPSKVLHRGILPTKGPRYVLALCLLPSPIPWQEAFHLNKGMMSADYTWQNRAETILQALRKTTQ